jgi:tripeptidyl-peptidase-1
MYIPIIVILGLLTAATAAPASKFGRHVIHERRDRLPTHWNKNSMLHKDSYIPLRIGLKQSNLHRADEFLMDVSHPDSPNFGKHWSAKQIAETFSPSEDSVSSVLDWLAEYGIARNRIKQSQSLNWIEAHVTAAEAETLLNTKYYKFKHAVTGQAHVACEEYSLPESMQDHIDFITPTVHFDVKVESPKKRRGLNVRELDIAKRQSEAGHYVQPGTAKAIGSPEDKSLPKYGGRLPFGTILDQLEHCDTTMVPNCLRALYHFPPYFPANPKSKSQYLHLLPQLTISDSYGIVEYTPQAYLPADLDKFFTNFSKAQVGARPILNSIDGGVLQTETQSFNYNGESVIPLNLPSIIMCSSKTGSGP